MNLLPPHGKIDCHDCFSDGQLQTSPHPKWLMRNDPGAWGSEKPKILILGFSKAQPKRIFIKMAPLLT